MEEPITPEEDLNQELRKQEREIHTSLFLINQLFMICNDESLSIKNLQQKCQPILNKMRKNNPAVAHEIDHLIKSGDRKKLLDFFEREKQELAETLQDELKQHKKITKRLNDQKTEQFPTDS